MFKIYFFTNIGKKILHYYYHFVSNQVIFFCSRKLVTGIHYTLKINGVVQNFKHITDFGKRTSRMMIETELLQQAYNLTFKLHVITSILLPYHQHFELYFRTELSTHDLQTVFSTQLTSVLRKKWKGMSFFCSIHDCFRKYY